MSTADSPNIARQDHRSATRLETGRANMMPSMTPLTTRPTNPPAVSLWLLRCCRSPVDKHSLVRERSSIQPGRQSTSCVRSSPIALLSLIGV